MVRNMLSEKKTSCYRHVSVVNCFTVNQEITYGRGTLVPFLRLLRGYSKMTIAIPMKLKEGIGLRSSMGLAYIYLHLFKLSQHNSNPRQP